MAAKEENTSSNSIWLRNICDRKGKSQTRVPPSLIIEARDADRKLTAG